MFICKVKTVHGTTEIFETEKYIISTVKDMHPDILEVSVYSGDKRIAHSKRHFQGVYKKFFYKPLREEVKQN